MLHPCVQCNTFTPTHPSTHQRQPTKSLPILPHRCVSRPASALPDPTHPMLSHAILHHSMLVWAGGAPIRLHSGVNFMEKEVSMRGGAHTVTFSIWDIGGSHQQNSGAMLPLVCNDAAVILLVFDLTRPETLDGLRKWHQRARGCNKVIGRCLCGLNRPSRPDLDGSRSISTDPARPLVLHSARCPSWWVSSMTSCSTAHLPTSLTSARRPAHLPPPSTRRSSSARPPCPSTWRPYSRSS